MKQLLKSKSKGYYDKPLSPIPQVSSPDLRCGLQTVYLMNVVPYLESLNLLKVFIFVSRKCYHSVKRQKINPFYCKNSILAKEKLDELKKEVRYFVGIETFQCDLEIIEKLPTAQMDKIQRFAICNKVIYTVPNLQLPIKEMVNLKRLNIDMNGNTEMMFFDSYMNNIFTCLQHFMFFHLLSIECNGIELVKVVSIVNKFEWKKIKVLLKCYELREEHMSWIEKLHVLMLIIIQSDILYMNEVLELCETHYLYRLDSIGLASFPIASPLINLSKNKSLKEFNLLNTEFQTDASITLPSSLTYISLVNITNVSIQNLALINLLNLSLQKTPIESIENLGDVPLQILKCVECNALRTITVPSTLKEMQIHWCTSITKISKIFETEIKYIELFQCQQLQPLNVPQTVEHLYITFCKENVIKNKYSLKRIQHKLI
ncbi:Leucine-rich repeat containing protein [Entamoeba marina]